MERERTDGSQRNEAEVSRIEERPVFPLAEEISATDYVADN